MSTTHSTQLPSLRRQRRGALVCEVMHQMREVPKAGVAVVCVLCLEEVRLL